MLVWDIRQFFHQGNQTAVEWYFKNRMQDGRVEEFDGISLIRWTADGKIASLKEFGCNKNTYDPYADGPAPRFRDEKNKLVLICRIKIPRESSRGICFIQRPSP